MRLSKEIIYLVSFLIPFISSHAQHIDSTLAQPQVLELSVSNPQPRVGETFTISMNMMHIRANIFRSLNGKVEISGNMNANSNDMDMEVVAVKKGKHTIGPLSFTINNTVYTTNAVTYEVIDLLPETDRGLWFRHVKISDTSFCIIIDQRIPVDDATTVSGTSMTYTTEPEHKDIAGFKDTYSIAGLAGLNSTATSTTDSEVIGGENRKFMKAHSVYYFVITEPDIKIRITRDVLKNIPADYRFKEIVIR